MIGVEGDLLITLLNHQQIDRGELLGFCNNLEGH